MVFTGMGLSFGQEVELGGMKVSWKHHDDSITFTASAPDDGWVALGFNSSNSIVKSNLVMISVAGPIVVAEDFFVVGAGNPQPVYALGGKSQLLNVAGTEVGTSTTISFTFPTTAQDAYHYNLKKGEQIWLICAYSMEDEFDHHSRMRKHIQITL